jgi:hypothetical protein
MAVSRNSVDQIGAEAVALAEAKRMCLWLAATLRSLP